MRGLVEFFRLSLTLHLRNRLGLLYGFLFPLVFLGAFAVLYRHEKIPLLLHFGELLTVTVLGGACFGLPTTLVDERERGVWRRYRLTPLPARTFLLGTLAARYVIVLGAGLLQLATALVLGMTAPAHPGGLWLAFTVATFAFMGLGLLIAALADNVPAVQALGQCIFLPMLMIGGVAVPLASLPPWAQRASAFFPGRYAVESLQACVTGPGAGAAVFGLISLGLIGGSGFLAGAMLFRWESGRRFLAQPRKAWALAALAAWLGVGLLSEIRGREAAGRPEGPPSSWKSLTTADAEMLDFQVPPDAGVVAPFAGAGEDPPDFIAESLVRLEEGLAAWPPAQEPDPVQRVRNLLCVAAVADILQHPLERHAPVIVFRHLSATHSRDELVRLLTWVALHPEDGGVVGDLEELGMSGVVWNPAQIRERVDIYALKFLARLLPRPAGSTPR